ncbi:MAG: hypothetical protein NDI77_12510 [Geobacteraceae bacterium]|nr:hypothetical protein [Geobacteraceae bacterium]
MADRNALETRVEELSRQLQSLTQKVEQLEARLERPADAWPPVAAPLHAAAASAQNPVFTEVAEGVSEEILSWAGKASLLPRLSTLCFLLVVALVLRTITDSNIINTLLGSALGMGYAAALIALGWHKYRRGSSLAPVFAACGAVLISVIVVETHSRFQSLPLVPAYMTLMASGAAMTFISYRFNVFLPISLGTLGICLAGAAIDYPDPFFPYLAMVLWTANILGFFAVRLKRCSWLRWIVLVVTMAMLSQWGIKLGMTLLGNETPPATLALSWFLPVIAAFAATYAGLALAGILRDGAGRITRFDFLLPTVNAAFTYPIAYYVVAAWVASRPLLGWVAVSCSLAHFGVAFWLAGRGTAAGAGANSFLLAGATLLALALPAASGSFLLTLPALAAVAFFLIIMSRHWQNGGTRAISYLVQLYAAGAMAVYLEGSGTAAVDFMTVIPAGLLTFISLYHYQLCRRFAPPASSTFFGRFDRHDRSAALLLMAALASGFFMLRAAVYQLLVMMPGDITNAFRCAQSILINVAAAGLMLYAVRRHNREIRNVAILVTLIGAGKVFLYDMLGTHGVPLVMSVFTFGLAAALESIALGRWPRAAAAGEGEGSDREQADDEVPAGQRQ